VVELGITRDDVDFLSLVSDVNRRRSRGLSSNRISAQAGYLFAAFGAVALLLLAVATVLALSRDRTLAGARGVREQLALWD
jgi:hypothetical protein